MTYDIIVVGGGIFGICCAWEASLRGLSTVLLEKGDFSQATSANHFKMVHGGIRYLQHGDIYRIRESSKERTVLLKIAPHLVKPVPIVIPTSGYGLKGKGVLAAGFLLYDFLTLDRNFGIKDAAKRIPRGSFLARSDVIKLFPGIDRRGLTGGAVFYDGQIYNPPRLGISFLRAASDRGAEAANYVEVTDFLRKGEGVCGVRAKDVFTGDTIEVRGKYVLNAAGPWASHLLQNGGGYRLRREPVFSRDLAFVVRKRIAENYGLTCLIRSKDADAILDRGGRHIFFMPWRGHTLIGVWHSVYTGDPDEIIVKEEELQRCIDEVNGAYPGLAISLDDITMVNTGLTLFGDGSEKHASLSFGKRSLLIDHQKEHGVDGLVTLIGVRATTARGMAEKAVGLICDKMHISPPLSETAVRPVFGGDVSNFSDFFRDALNRSGFDITEEVFRALIYNYGSRYKDPMEYVKENSAWGERVADSGVLKAEVIHATREEMAMRLEDVVLRRTDLGTADYPGERALKECAQLMGEELHWTEDRIEEEIGAVRSAFENRCGVKKY